MTLPRDGAVGPFVGESFSGENPLKMVLPQTPFLNFELCFDWPSRANQNLAPSLGGGRGGQPFTKGSPHRGANSIDKLEEKCYRRIVPIDPLTLLYEENINGGC